MFAICRELEVVDLIHIADIGCCRLVGHIHRVIDRKVPNRKGLEFSISTLETVPIIVIQLTETGGKFSTPWSRRGNNNHGMLSLYVGVRSISFITDIRIDVGWIPIGRLMRIDLDLASREPIHELDCCRLPIEPRYHHTGHLEIPVCKIVDHLEDVGIVGDAEITSDLPSLDIVGINAHNHIYLVLKRLEHPHLHIRIEAGKYT